LLINDPTTGLLLLLGIVLPLLRMKHLKGKENGVIFFAIGSLIYIVYVIVIGGDFMAGRFFSPPLLVSFIVLGITCSKIAHQKIPIGAAVALIIVGCLVGSSPVRSDIRYGTDRKIWGDIIDEHGVADERAFYYRWCGLMRVGIPKNKNFIYYKEREASIYKKRNKTTIVKGNIGYFGYFAGPTVDILDYLGLTDPLLARLPASDFEGFRPGHIKRSIPEGYIESRKNKKVRIADAQIEKFNEKILKITQGNLFSINRFKTIIEFNFGKYDDLIESDRR
jgi:arabinofuranosyltransferase